MNPVDGHPDNQLRTRTISSYAVASLVFGALGLVLLASFGALFSILAICCGHTGRK
jgi:hypothetical protein